MSSDKGFGALRLLVPLAAAQARIKTLNHKPQTPNPNLQGPRHPREHLYSRAPHSRDTLPLDAPRRVRRPPRIHPPAAAPLAAKS